MLLVRLGNETPARTLKGTPLAPDGFYQPLHGNEPLIRSAFDGGVSADLREIRIPTVRSIRAPVLVVLLVVVAAAVWYYRSQRLPGNGETIAVYYTKLDGKSLGDVSVSVRPREPGESAAEHLHNVALYAAVQAIAGPPNEIEAIRFPAGTRVNGVEVTGSTATVDLSKDVERQAGGSFGENGEFKALVYTLTGISGIDAVQVTIDGAQLETLPGGHLELDQPLHRSDW